MSNWTPRGGRKSGNKPDEKAIQVRVCPLLALPPVVGLPLLDVIGHRDGRRGLGDDPQEQRTPVDGGLMRLQVWWQLKLETKGQLPSHGGRDLHYVPGLDSRRLHAYTP